MLSQFPKPVSGAVGEQTSKPVLGGGKVDVDKIAGSHSKQQFIRQAPGKSMKEQVSKGSSQRRTQKVAKPDKSATGPVVPDLFGFAALDDDTPTPADKFIMHVLRNYHGTEGHTASAYKGMDSVNAKISELHKMMSKLR